MRKVVLLGEPLLRLSPEGNMRFLQADKMDVHFGGAEANVAVCLASLGVNCYYVGKVPKHAMGQAFINALNREGVHTDYIARGGERIGIYFLENGASVRSSQVIYDRAYSSMSEAKVTDFDWEEILEGTSLLHVTGITPVISEQAAILTMHALREAKKRNILVSLDLNYRAKLWQDNIEIKQKWMSELAQYADYCFGNPLDAAKTLGYTDKVQNLRETDFQYCVGREMVERMAQQYDFTGIFFTLRESCNASFNRLAARAYWKGEFLETDKVDLQIVDRIGGGDAFAAGILYGIVQNMNLRDMLAFGLTTGAIAHTIPGDFAMTTVEEVNSIIKNGGTGRVER